MSWNAVIEVESEITGLDIFVDANERVRITTNWSPLKTSQKKFSHVKNEPQILFSV